jgi:hypothetical protein
MFVILHFVVAVVHGHASSILQRAVDGQGYGKCVMPRSADQSITHYCLSVGIEAIDSWCRSVS